ncbi:hypothetical protein CHS0354_031007, partial [Potamilus streckersoni]
MPKITPGTNILMSQIISVKEILAQEIETTITRHYSPDWMASHENPDLKFKKTYSK